MKLSLSPLLLFLLSFLWIQCAPEAKQVPEETAPENKTTEFLPFSTGKVNTLSVYLDPGFQSGMMKDSLFYYFDQPYLLTPIPSPVIDLKVSNFETFVDGSSRNANNLIVVNINENSQLSTYAKKQLGENQINEALKEKSMALVRVNDINAQPQQLFYLLTKDYPNLTDKKMVNQLEDYIQSVVEESLELDNQRLASSISQKRNRSLEDQIEEEFGLKIWIPREYEVMIEDENMIWLLFEPASRELYSNILIYRSNSYDSKKLEDRVLPMRNDLGKYVTTTQENTYMITHVNSKPYPIQREISINEKPVIETRGLWEIENDYLGGGFVNYTLKNKRGETISIDGFVYYSEDDIRRKMRDIDAILSTVQID